MNHGKPTRKPKYRSPLREEQAARTRERIEKAAASLIKATRNPEVITFKAVAHRAGVTEMTVYRHFPTREDLLRGLWRQLFARSPSGIGMPGNLEALQAQHADLFAGFDKAPHHIEASVTTPQGREMQAALNNYRCRAFRAIVDEVAPGLKPEARTCAAAVLQLLHSAHAWMSLREQWNMDGREAGAATRWAIDIILEHLRKKP
jgi:AcrR family transcriptional regulator